MNVGLYAQRVSINLESVPKIEDVALGGALLLKYQL